MIDKMELLIDIYTYILLCIIHVQVNLSQFIDTLFRCIQCLTYIFKVYQINKECSNIYKHHSY